MSAHVYAVGAPDPEPVDWALFDGPVRYFGQGDAVTDLVPDDLRSHRRRFGERPVQSSVTLDGLIHAIDEAELTGRGGAHRPVAQKWRAVRAAQGDAVVIGNGAEGEPDSRKDLALLEFRPHLVLDGLACTAEALGAREVIVWLHRDADVARVAVTHALAERRAAGLREPKVRVELGPSGYLSGESSAVVRALSGGPARPTFRPLPFAPQRLGGRPALVNNVDTLARVGLLVRGAATDTVLVTVTIGDARIVVEAGSSTLVHDLLARIGGVDSGAVLLGGYGGVWAGWDQLSGVRVSEADLRRRGLSLGAGVLSVLPADRCGLARTAELADYLAQQSAGQCGPCLFGLRSVADAVAALTRGGRRSRSQVRELGRYLAEVRGRGACGHPDGAVRMVSSALTVFADDVNAHLRGRCVARVGHQ